MLDRYERDKVAWVGRGMRQEQEHSVERSSTLSSFSVPFSFLHVPSRTTRLTGRVLTGAR